MSAKLAVKFAREFAGETKKIVRFQVMRVATSAVMRTAACVLLLVCVCGGDGRSADVGEPAVGGTGPQPQCGQAFDWERARQEYFYLSKVMVTDLGGNCAHRIAAEGRAAAAAPEPGAGPVWLRENDPLVSQNEFCNTDIRSHLKELFTFTLFFAPRTIVELGVRSGWSTRVFSAAAKLVGAKMIGIDLSESCKDVYARVVGEAGGFAVTGDSADMAADFPLWVSDRHDLGLANTVDLLFIDTSHLYEDTVRELAAWAPLLSEKAAIVLHDTNLPSSCAYARKDGSAGEGWDNERGVIRAVQDFVNVSFGNAHTCAHLSS